MAEKIKIYGGDFSFGPSTKIPRDTTHQCFFRPDYELKDPDENPIDLMQDRIRLELYEDRHENEEPFESIEPSWTGEKFIFEFDPSKWGKEIDTSWIIGKINKVRADNQAFLENFAQFGFQVEQEPPTLEMKTIRIRDEGIDPDRVQPVSLNPTVRKEDVDVELWNRIKQNQTEISFREYQLFIDTVCSDKPLDYKTKNFIGDLGNSRSLPFTDTDAHKTIKVLTEAFLLLKGGIQIETDLPKYGVKTAAKWGDDSRFVSTLPYLEVIRRKLRDISMKPKSIGEVIDALTKPWTAAYKDLEGYERIAQDCHGILERSMKRPSFIELIWNYWHEESMLIQGINAICRRFQNVRSPGKGNDPLSHLEIGPLRPLNNLLWGYIQDEQHRLSVKRRAYEYDHHYGISLVGKAVPKLSTVDSRKNFLEAFHNLLHTCTKFYKQEDDMTVLANGFPVLESLRDVHFILSQGMHNQYGDLTFTSRVEMMMEQWLISRPEFREFLPTRMMVAYPEDWMGPVSTMNQIQGWTTTSPVQFSNLGRYGETILLSIRFGNWSATNLGATHAAVWANYFRDEIQGYMHAYRAVTGVDISLPHPQTGKIDTRPPAYHLLKRLQSQNKQLKPVRTNSK